MKHILFTLMALAVCLAAGAQNTDKIYKEAKALYDAKQYVQAVPKLKVAAEKGHKKAQYRLGRCYEKGHGVAKDPVQAVKWYQLSAKQDYAKAQYRLGKCYMKGKGVAVDEQQATLLLKKAVSSKKHGKEILKEIKEEAAEGDEDEKKILKLIGK